MYPDFAVGNASNPASQNASPYNQSFGGTWSQPSMTFDTAGQAIALTPFWQNISNQAKLTLDTNTGSVPTGALSATTLAFLAAAGASGSLDPSMSVYDENTGGYATPSYAGSIADDSSFDDRDLDSQTPFSRPVLTHYNTEQRQIFSQPFLNAGSDLYAFRDVHRGTASDWDSASSVSGAADEPQSRASPANIHASPELGSKAYSNEGNGLEMAVGRMFAPIESPKLFPPSPARNETLRAASASPGPEIGTVEPVFTASPSHSPRLAAQDVPASVPTFQRLSPSPTSPAFRTTSPPDGQPALRSPPLSNGVGRTSAAADQNRLSALAPLLIPAAPDLTLTTATPTAVPRTATIRQDSTQAALDTVFSTFFDKANHRPARTVCRITLAAGVPKLTDVDYPRTRWTVVQTQLCHRRHPRHSSIFQYTI